MKSQANKRRDIRTPISCAVYYSDGAFHASGMTENLTNHGGCVRGTHLVKVGMELMVLLIPSAKNALMIKKATVRWAGWAENLASRWGTPSGADAGWGVEAIRATGEAFPADS
jgi:hypothetical protein